MKEKLRKYYLYGLLPALLIALGLTVFFDLMYACYFMVGFSWPYSYYTPNLREKIALNPSRVTFMSLSFQCHDFLFRKLGERLPHYLIRGVMPIVFASLNFAIAYDKRCLTTILGFICFELFWAFSKKRKLDIFQV